MKLHKLVGVIAASALFLGACGSNEDSASTDPEETEVVNEETESDGETTEVDEEIDEGTEDLEASDGTDEGEVTESEFGTMTVLSKKLDINETQENGPFQITLMNAQVAHLVPTEDYVEFFGGDDLTVVAVELTVENTVEDTNVIYPDQGTIVTNTSKQVDANMLISDSIGGDFLGEVIKEGTVLFTFEDDPEAIDNVRYIIGSGSDENYENFGEDIEFSIDF